MASLTKNRHGNLRIKFRLPGHPQIIRKSLPGGPFKATRENIAWANRTFLLPLKKMLAADDLAAISKLFPDSRQLKALGIVPPVTVLTLGQFARHTWLQEFVQRDQRHSTVLSYEVILHRWIEPCTELMKRPIAELTPADGAAFVNWLTQRPGSAVARNKALRQLGRILKRARQLGLLERDPLLGIRAFTDESVELIEQREQELGAWTLEERDRLIESATAIAPWQGAAVTVAFFTGLRRGELFGLQWRDIDFEGDKMLIRRSLRPTSIYPVTRLAAVFATNRIPSGNQHESLPKTAGSRGAIEMLPEVRDALLGQRERLGAAFLLSCPWVFPNEHGDGPQQVHNFSKRLWSRIVELAGVPYRAMKQTRHTFAVLALQAGAELVWVQRQLRHASMQMLVNNYLKYAQARPTSVEFARAFGVSTVGTGPPMGHPAAGRNKS
jgi:integrase